MCCAALPAIALVVAQQVRQTAATLEIHQTGETRTPQVGVDQQHAFAGLDTGDMPRFASTVVLPSPGSALLTATQLSSCGEKANVVLQRAECLTFHSVRCHVNLKCIQSRIHDRTQLPDHCQNRRLQLILHLLG